MWRSHLRTISAPSPTLPLLPGRGIPPSLLPGLAAASIRLWRLLLTSPSPFEGGLLYVRTTGEGGRRKKERLVVLSFHPHSLTHLLRAAAAALVVVVVATAAFLPLFLPSPTPVIERRFQNSCPPLPPSPFPSTHTPLPSSSSKALQLYLLLLLLRLPRSLRPRGSVGRSSATSLSPVVAREEEYSSFSRLLFPLSSSSFLFFFRLFPAPFFPSPVPRCEAHSEGGGGGRLRLRRLSVSRRLHLRPPPPPPLT